MTPRLRPAALPVRPARRLACRSPSAFAGGCVDLSIGTPCDPPPAAVVAALSTSDSERGLPAEHRHRRAAARRSRDWIDRRFGVDGRRRPTSRRASAPRSSSAPLPQWLRLRTPDRDTVLYPAVAYPTYEMGAILAGCRPVPVPLDADGGARPGGDRRRRRRAGRWRCGSTRPGNPTGALDDLGAAAAWGRAHDVPVFSDECYVEFTWDGPGRTILEHGLDGVVAVHSLSKRSNLAGVRVGFYAGDAELVRLPAARCASTSG